MLFVFLILCSCFSRDVLGQRNAQAEGMCQPFLTSNFSSPLIPDIRRNLQIDEDGEYFCELVLQDRDLPAQVRVTIHEGLSYLAIRHVQMGLERHTDVLRHLKILANMVPSNFNFQFRAGVWCLDPMLAEPSEAVDFLRSALYGEASSDTSADTEALMEARKHFALALGLTGDFMGAQKELLLILKHFPLDFGAAFYLRDTVNQLKLLNIETSLEVSEEIEAALVKSESFYASVNEHSEVKYTGFQTTKGWAPREFHGVMPSPSDFEEFVNRREPFITHTSSKDGEEGNKGTLDSALNWQVSQWSNVDYLRSTVGDGNVLVEKTQEGVKNMQFGFSSSAFKRKTSFATFLDDNFSKESVSNEFLNLQEGYFRDSIWNSPLGKLKKDIPVPTCLASHEDNITAVNLWMSNAPEGSSCTTRLHMDPMDSLYVVISGRKQFTLFSPDKTPNLGTISPTYGVSPDGFSFQYNSPAKLPTLDNKQMQGHELGRGHYHYSSLTASELKNGVVVELSAGDVLFLPAGWYHEVTTDSGPSMAVNYWWLPKRWRDTLALEKEMKQSLLEKLRGGTEGGGKGDVGEL